MEHADAEGFLGAVPDGGKEADADFGDVFGVGDVAARADVDVGANVVEVVGLRKLFVGTEVGGFTSIRRDDAIARQPWRVLSTLTGSCLLSRKRGGSSDEADE